MSLDLPIPDLLAALVGGGGVVLGLAAGVRLWRLGGVHRQADRLLAVFLAAGALTLLHELVRALQLHRLSDHFWITPLLYTFVLGPALYLFVRVRAGEPLRPRDGLHAVLPAYQIVHEVVTGFAPLSFKDAFWQSGYGAFTVAVDTWVFALGFGAYLLAALRVTTTSDGLGEDRAWVRRLLAVCLGILGVAVALELVGLSDLDRRDGGAIDWAELGGILAYTGLMYWTATTAVVRILGRPSPSEPRPARQETYGLDEAAVARHADALRALVETERPHLDPDLTLGALGARLGLSDKELSLVLNAGLGVPYAEYIGGLRVEEARRRLASDPDAPVLEAGLAAGFASKATFNRVFKRVTGRTPTQYRAEARLKPS